MTGVALGIDIDLSTDFLEDRLTNNCKCEHSHTSPSGASMGPCSLIATHRWIADCGARPDNICEKLARLVTYSISVDFGTCADCKRRSIDCWRVVAI